MEAPGKVTQEDKRAQPVGPGEGCVVLCGRSHAVGSHLTQVQANVTVSEKIL